MHSDHLQPGCIDMRDALVPPMRTMSTFVLSGARVSSGAEKSRASTPAIGSSSRRQLCAADPKPAVGQTGPVRFMPMNLWAKVVGPTRRWKVSPAPRWLYDYLRSVVRLGQECAPARPW